METWATAASGRVLDAGCGPGHWTSHLANLGIDIQGVDQVAEFIGQARSTYPAARFEFGNIDALDVEDGTLAGILSWFSTIHHDPARISYPLTEFARTLRPGGRLLLGYFDGEEIERFDHAVACAYRWPASELHAKLEAAGFDIIETHRRVERGHRPVGAIICELSLSAPI